MSIEVALITEGNFEIVETTAEELIESIDVSRMSFNCINKEKRLFVAYDNEYFYENDSQDYQYVFKVKSNNAKSIEQLEIESLTDEDIAFIDKRHGTIFGIYSYWSRFAIELMIMKKNKIKIETEDLAELYEGNTILQERCEKLLK